MIPMKGICREVPSPGVSQGKRFRVFSFPGVVGEDCILLHLIVQCSRQHLLCPDNISLVYEISFVVLI